jgi:putative intracellular protease/amidase
MKERRGFLWLSLLALILVSGVCQAAPKVLLIARERSAAMELMISEEVDTMVALLQKAGFTVDIATETGNPIEAGSARLVPDLKLADVNSEDYVGLVLPCMAAGDVSDNVPAASVPITKEMAAAGKPIAAQNAWEMLQAAGFTLAKYKVAINPGVVVDGKLVTSSNCPLSAHKNHKPVDTPKLIEEFVKLLEAQ